MVIVPLEESDVEVVRKLADRYDLPLSMSPPEGYYLTLEEERLVVKDSRQSHQFRISPDLGHELARVKSQRVSPKKDLLSRAVGFKGEENYIVFDGTLGFAKDAIHLIALGASVIGCERNLALYALINEAKQNVRELDSYLDIIHGESLAELEKHADKINCFYFDPMFENLKKKSAPKKQMAFLREVLDDSDDAQKVIERALELRVKRMVVKRPINSEHLYRKPDITYKGNLIRYDVYTG